MPKRKQFTIRKAILNRFVYAWLKRTTILFLCKKANIPRKMYHSVLAIEALKSRDDGSIRIWFYGENDPLNYQAKIKKINPITNNYTSPTRIRHKLVKTALAPIHIHPYVRFFTKPKNAL